MIQMYDDNLQDENTVLAFRMLVKDLLVLFQAGNEGVCNILGELVAILGFQLNSNRALLRDDQDRRPRFLRHI